MRCFLGIDIGGTNTKAVIFDRSGREISKGTAATPVESPQDGFYERDMEALWETTCMCVRQAVEGLGASPDKIAGVGCSGHGKGLYLWGKDSRPARAGIASTDRRAAEIVRRWEKDETAKKAKERTLQPLLACQPAPLLRWLVENEPDTVENIQWIFECKDYIRFRLTGEAGAERTDISGTSLLNLRTGKPDRELMELFGISGLFDAIPPLRGSAEVCGEITAQAAAMTGLVPGTPVCGGMFDIDACATAMGVFREDQLCMITGTWSINEYPSTRPVPADSGTNCSLFCLEDRYLIEESSPTSAGNLDWYIRNFMKEEGAEAYSLADRLVSGRDPRESDAVFLPFLYGGCAGCEGGAFAGLTDRCDSADMLRAIFEGVAYSHRYHVGRLMKFREPPESIRIAGGAVNSPVWMQIFADVLGTTLETVKTKQLGALGCAIAAAVAAGDFPDLKTAAQGMVETGRRIHPNTKLVPVYNEKYRRYLKLIRRMEGF